MHKYEICMCLLSLKTFINFLVLIIFEYLVSPSYGRTKRLKQKYFRFHQNKKNSSFRDF